MVHLMDFVQRSPTQKLPTVSTRRLSNDSTVRIDISIGEMSGKRLRSPNRRRFTVAKVGLASRIIISVGITDR